MGVDVQGERGGGMAQGFLHGLNVVTGPERCHGVRVAKIVKTGVRAANGGRHSLEVTINQRL